MERLIKAKVEPGRVAIHWLGQGGFAFKAHAGDVIVVDPYLSDSANKDGNAARLVDIPVRPKDVRLDYLFLTHDHDDHTDPQTAPVLAQNNPDAVVVCPPSSARHLAKLGVAGTQIRTAMPGQSLDFPNFVAHVVPAQHTEDSVGYVFEFNDAGSESDNVAVYITGDTEYNDALAAAVEDYGPDVLLVPINGRGATWTPPRRQSWQRKSRRVKSSPCTTGCSPRTRPTRTTSWRCCPPRRGRSRTSSRS